MICMRGSEWNMYFKKVAHKNVDVVLCYPVHFHKWMRTWTPTVSHGSNNTIQAMWGGAYFENTRGHGAHNFKKTAHKNVNFVLCYTVHFWKWMRGWTPTVSYGSNDTIETMWGCAHFENTRVHGAHIFKKPSTKMLTLCYVLRCIFENECEGEPLRCLTVPATPSIPCEVAPTSRTLAYTEHIISKNRP